MNAMRCVPAPEGARATEAPAARLVVQALAYRRLAPDRAAALADLGLEGATAALAELVADEGMKVRALAQPFDSYLMVSTILSPLLMEEEAPLARSFTGRIAARLGRPPDAWTTAYECSGWGFALRHEVDRACATGRVRRVLLQIVDVDIHGFVFWRRSVHWGDSGFGLASVVIDALPGVGSPVQIGLTAHALGLVTLAAALRDYTRSRPGMALGCQFSPEARRRALLSRVSNPTLPNGYARFGHSFGSDPWISLLMRPEPDAGRHLILSSQALHGSFAIAEVELAAEARLRLETGP